MFKENVIKNKNKRDFEKKHRLKVLALRNKFLGEWASNILGLNDLQKKKYITRVTKSEICDADYKIIIKDIEKDFKKKDIKISSREIEFKIKDFQLKANVIIENKLKLNTLS